MEITEQQYKEWNNAVINASLGSHYGMQTFKEDYPELYRHMSSMLQKRTKIKTIIKALETVSPSIYWGALTWNEDENDASEKTKRRQALRFFDKHFKLYMFVEEHGEENNRYHIHFFGILKERYEDYASIRQDWHSYLQIELLKGYEYQRKVKYLTNYVVKDVPRVRMSKRLVKIVKDYQRANYLHASHFKFQEEEYTKSVMDLVDLPF